MFKSVLTKTPKETQKLAGAIIKKLLFGRAPNAASVVGFSGELGSGKTTLIQGLGRALGVKEKIQSPTFVLIRTYALGHKRKIPWKRLVHIDAYRLEKKEIRSLGLKNIFKNAENLVAIEWAEKMKNILPRDALWVELQHKSRTHRHIIIKNDR